MVLMSKHVSNRLFSLYVLTFTLSDTVNFVVDRINECTWRQKYWYRILPKNKWRSIADTHFDTAYEKYHRYLRQYSKSIADTIGSNTSTAILTTVPG